MKKKDSSMNSMKRPIAISAALAAVTYIGFYVFFIIHQELGISPFFALKLGLLVLLLGLAITTIRSRMSMKR
jgi:hypothetical protein